MLAAITVIPIAAWKNPGLMVCNRRAPTTVPTTAIRYIAHNSRGEVFPAYWGKVCTPTPSDRLALRTTASVGVSNSAKKGTAASAKPKPVKERSTVASTVTHQIGARSISAIPDRDSNTLNQAASNRVQNQFRRAAPLPIPTRRLFGISIHQPHKLSTGAANC